MKLRSTHRGLGRAAAVVFALLQLGASTAFVLADAVLDGEQAGAPVHVESQGSEECSTHHDHLFCQVVRSLASAAPGPGVATLEAHAAISSRRGPVHSSDAHPASAFSGASGPRAPPLV